MTHHLQVEKQLAAQDAKVVVVAKMAALGEIAASVVHEINNALTVVQGLARRSRREFADNAKVVSAFTQIERSSDRIGQIVKGVSKFSHSSADESTQYDGHEKKFAAQPSTSNDQATESLRVTAMIRFLAYVTISVRAAFVGDHTATSAVVEKTDR